MIPATTPTFNLTIKGEVDLHLADHIYITIRQGPTVITIDSDHFRIAADNKLSCYLTQAQSLQLVEGSPAKIQVNWTYTTIQDEIRRAATKTATICVTEQLLRRVVE